MIRVGLSILLSMLLSISAQAVDFKWMNNKGEIHALADTYKGQPTMVHIWASWCPPCVAEMPEMAAWLKKHPEVNVIIVSLDHDLETAQAFLQKNHIAIPTLLTDQSQAANLRVRGLPTTLLIDAKDNIITSRVGMQSWQKNTWTNTVLTLFPTTTVAEIAR